MQMLQDILGLIFLYYSSEFLFFFLFLFLALAILVVITHGVGETGSANGTPTDFPDRCAIFIIPTATYTKQKTDQPKTNQESPCARGFNTLHSLTQVMTFIYFFVKHFIFFFFLVVSNSALWSNVIKKFEKRNKAARPHAVKWINPLFSLFLLLFYNRHTKPSTLGYQQPSLTWRESEINVLIGLLCAPFSYFSPNGFPTIWDKKIVHYFTRC